MAKIWRPEVLKVKDWKGETGIKWMQEKADGHQCSLYQQSFRKTIAWAKNKEITDKVRSWPWFQEFTGCAPAKTMAIGELVVPGEPATSVSSALAGNLGGLKFRMFSLPWESGVDYRKQSLDLTWKSARLMFEGIPFIRPVQYKGQTEKELCELAEERGIEGFVLKQANMEGWYRVKPVRTVDCVVIGSYPGKGKYKGLIGGLYAGVYDRGQLVQVAKCSGMRDPERRAITKRGKQDFGRVFEVAYQDVTKNQKLKFARFIRWRDDKDADMCTIDQLH